MGLETGIMRGCGRETFTRPRVNICPREQAELWRGQACSQLQGGAQDEPAIAMSAYGKPWNTEQSSTLREKEKKDTFWARITSALAAAKGVASD